VKGTTFTLSVDVTKAPGTGYFGIQTEIEFAGAAGLTYKPATDDPPPGPTGPRKEIVWPDGALPLRSIVGTLVNHADATSAIPPFPNSSFAGNILELNVNCSAANSTGNVVTLVPLGAGNSNGSGFKPTGGGANIPQDDEITIDCVQAPPTPTTPPTNTPPTNPRMQKLCDSNGDTVVDGSDSAQCNLFLTRQGTKVPPLTCEAGNDAATFSEVLNIPIPTLPDPKDPSIDQELGAFEFEIHFDDTKVCVNIEAGPAADDMICIIEDKNSSNLEGVARIGCVTQGKDNFPDTETADGRHLADVVIKPQPDVYSQAKPNQDNGVVVQVNNVLCELADLQGHPIPVFSCEDADVTIRYLEGDVEPDCEIDALDTQAVAFRWGVEKGSLIYSEFMNLEPSGTQADNDIDIKDLQFVFGRFGSTCDAPHPPQEPVNPKA
jgi:hypothetical protein